MSFQMTQIIRTVEMEVQMKSNKKFWKPPSFEDFNASAPNKKIRLDSDEFCEVNCFEDLWASKEPTAVSELAVHPKKIQEVRKWIRESLREKASILLITGPAGSGKTTTVKVSASEERVMVKEWINPIDKTEFQAESIFQNEVYDRFSFSESKQIDKFENFIFHSSRYKSLFENEENALLLVEDIPNIFVWRPKHFHSFLEKYKNYGRSPIVFILTDDQNLNLNSNLFPSHIKSKFNITSIKFNPVNHSALIKNLKLLSTCYCSEKVSSHILESIVKNSGGDVRSAANDLLLLLRTDGPNLSSLPEKTKKAKTSNGLGLSSKSLSLKDPNFDFYHVIGRILYPKLTVEVDYKNPNQILLHDVRQIAASWSISFLGVLHENYLHTFTKLKDVVEGAECFSFCDVLEHHQNLGEYVSLTGVITLMLRNSEPKKTGFNPIKKSVRFESNGSDCGTEMEQHFYGHQLSKRDFLLDVTPFLNILKVNDEDNGQSFGIGSQMKTENDEMDEDLIEIEEFDD